MEKQVNKEHYNFSKYSHLDRWGSYYYQMKESLDLLPQSILEIGVGDGVFGSFIKNNTSIEYRSFDIAEDLGPDIVGDVTNISLPDNSYDLVCAFEVLEHLPFEKFEKAIKELIRVSKRHLIISLPHFGPPVQFLLKIPFFPKVKFSFKIPWYKEHTFNGEHYWEIGKNGYPTSKVIEAIGKYGNLRKHFVPFENQYHHFFIIEK